MKARNRVVIVLAGIMSLALVLSGCGGAKDQGKKDTYPDKPVEFVVHTNPGDGVETFIRTAGDTMNKEKMVGQPINIINKVGGSGAAAMSYVADKKSDQYTLITAQPSTLTTPLRNNLKVSYKNFTPICNMIAEESVVAVRTESPFKSMSDLIEAAKKSPKSVSHGVEVLGSADTILDYMIAKKTGVQFNMISFKGGSENMIALLGGNVDFITVNPSEAVGQVQAGKVRLLGVASNKRMAKLPDVPTLKEQGIDVVFQSFRGVNGTAEMKPETVKYWEDAFKKVTQAPAWKKYLEDNYITDTYMNSADFSKYLAEQEVMYKEILTEMGVIKK